MEKKEENNTEINQSFKLSAIVGIWESLNLHPTVMIYQSKKKYSKKYMIFGIKKYILIMDFI